MIQIILGIIIVVIGVFVFYKYPIKSDIKQLTLAALIIVMAIVLKRLSIMIPFLGLPSLKITLEVLPLIIGGLLLQPTYCYLLALSVDGLGLVLASAGGFPFLGFTLNALLQTLIPCFLVKYLSDKKDIKLGLIAQVGMVILGVVASVYVFTMSTVSISSTIYEVTMPIKILVIAIIIIMISLLLFVANYYRKKLDIEKYHMFSIVILSVVLIELIVTFTLTPYWLQEMYGIPFYASLFVRVIKACIMVPINIIIVYTIYNVINRNIKIS